MKSPKKIENSWAFEKKRFMRIGISTDFAWFELKRKLIESLNAVNYELIDIEDYELVPGENYPDFLIPLVIKVYDENDKYKQAHKLYCNKACAEVNKIQGVCAAIFSETTATGVESGNEDLYVRCLGGQIKGYALTKKKILTFLNADCPTSIPSNRRLAKVRMLNRENITHTEVKYLI